MMRNYRKTKFIPCIGLEHAMAFSHFNDKKLLNNLKLCSGAFLVSSKILFNTECEAKERCTYDWRFKGTVCQAKLIVTCAKW